MNDLQKARELLESEGYTCVLCKGDTVYTSRHRGVRPLMDLLDQDTAGFSAADKVVGKATALLYRLLGVKEIYAHTISEAALEVLAQGQVPVQWQEKVPYIKNRAGDGHCPMEMATASISDPTLAPDAIRKKLRELQN